MRRNARLYTQLVKRKALREGTEMCKLKVSRETTNENRNASLS